MDEQAVIKRTLKDWVLVELCDESGEVRHQVVWGEPIDAPGRFRLTSPIQRIVEEHPGETLLVETRNSWYRLAGRGCQVRLPLGLADLLAQGHSPIDLKGKQGAPMPFDYGRVTH